MNLKINKNIILGYDKPPALIAEVSGNHKGSKDLFLKHIISAKNSGSDFVKIQTYEPEDITINNRDLKIKKGLWKNKSLWDLYKKAHTPFEWHFDAFNLAKKKKINLFSTPFSIRALKFLDKFKPQLYKISSFEINDFNLIDQIAKRRKPIIISTGMSDLKDINNAKKIINKYHNKLVIMYCVSGYPTPIKESNINTIDLLKKNYPKNLIGLSDHTNDIYSSLAASSLGVSVIEKHFIISKKIKSEDNKFSITPEKFKTLSRFSKQIHNSIGKGEIQLKDSEKGSLFFRRSLYALKDIRKGEKFTNQNIISLRPKIGISTSEYFKVLGKKTKKKLRKFDPIHNKFLTK